MNKPVRQCVDYFSYNFDALDIHERLHSADVGFDT
jgi:hypothetical protein